MLLLPQGFKATSYQGLLGQFTVMLGSMLYDHLGLTEQQAKPWIETLEQQGLIRFATSSQGEPSLFIAPQEAFPHLDDAEFAMKLVLFWDKSGEYDAAHGHITSVAVPSLPPSNLPHWQVALDRKMEAIQSLKFIEKLPRDHKFAAQINWMDLNDDLQALRASDTYSFSVETMHAIMMGAKSIPHESTLKSIELPQARAGWFWFAIPFPVASSPMASETTAALLWSWDTHLGFPALRFSAYVRDEKGALRDHVIPSTKWLWPLDFSFHDMVALSLKLYRQAYGVGGPYANQKHLIGEKQTLLVVAELSLFFLMACLWFRQTVPGKATLIQTDGHIERHARKRYQKELNLDAPPKVRVVALRKAVASPVEAEEGLGDPNRRHLTVRFVVSGHARLQPCGPGRVDRKLIWIDAHIRGPEDAPFKSASERVFAVVR